MLLLDMASKNEGTLRRRFLSLRMAVALSLFGIAQCQEPGEDLTVAGTTTKTIRVSSTSTTTIQAHLASAVPSKNMPKGDVYILQGCYRPNVARSIDTMLGQDATSPNATARDGMTLSACLDFCKVPASTGTQSKKDHSLSLYVGLSNGK